MSIGSERPRISLMNHPLQSWGLVSGWDVYAPAHLVIHHSQRGEALCGNKTKPSMPLCESVPDDLQERVCGFCKALLRGPSIATASTVGSRHL